MDYDEEGVRPRCKPRKTWSEVIEKKRLPDPTNMQGRRHGPYEMKKVN